MDTILYPYLVAVVAMILVLTAGFVAFVRYQRLAEDHRVKAQRIPDFVRWTQLSDQIADLETRREELRQSVAQAEALVMEAAQARDFLDKNAEVLRQTKEAQTQLQATESQLVSTREQLAIEKQELQKAQESLSKANFDRAEEERQAHRLRKEEESLQLSAKELREAIVTLELERKRLQDVSNELSSKNAALHAEVSGLDARKSQLGPEVAALKEQHEKLNTELTQAQGETNRLRNEQAELQQASSRLRDSVTLLEAERKQLSDETNNLSARIAGLQTGIAGLEQQKAQLEPAVEALAKQRAQLNNDLADLSSETHRLEGLKARLTGELGPQEAADPEQKLQDLQEPLFDPQHLWEPSDPHTELVALDRVTKHLRDSDLKFSDRVVRAFHTALKVQGESPLLVLAGISGTGKSLLPQKYAEAMGIHCHVVPVQPRWDGPQDLLGFYHHLEQRYKATPLTRGLLQFDRFSKLHGKDKNLSERMLLVVLDEMNIARVEYYFSEFLSKLETRRDVDLEDPEQRKRASIALDLGTRIEGEDSPALMVDRNVLFVGTINEDESTQTLSDKVVDRANVIRFGRPKSLAHPTHRGPAPATIGQHMPWHLWNDWLSKAEDLSSQQLRFVNSSVEQLNNALSGIGKSFGHRTSHAIHSYVKHYPERSESGIRMAIADQIEQRVLPKLRGLDPKEHASSLAIAEVLAVVSSLNDDKLVAAMEHGRDGHSFHWQGVERSE